MASCCSAPEDAVCPSTVPLSQSMLLPGWWAPYEGTSAIDQRVVASAIGVRDGQPWFLLQAVNAGSGLRMGLLAPAAGPAVPLLQPLVGLLTTPRDVLALTDGSFVVVGGGYSLSPTAPPLGYELPTVALYNPACATLEVVVGGGPTLLPDEMYVALSRAGPTTVWCAGTGGSDAVLRLLDLETLLPTPLATGAPYAAAGLQNAVATCVTPLPAAGLLVVGVVVQTQGPATSLLWPLTPGGAPLSSPYATMFNSPVTGRLALPPACLGLTIQRVLAVNPPAGPSVGPVLVTVCTGVGDPADPASVPPSFAVLHAFGADTAPYLPWAGTGIVSWAAGASTGSFRPTGGVLGGGGCLAVAGNTWAAEVYLGAPDSVALLNPATPWLDFAVSQPEQPVLTLTLSPPQPWLATFSLADGSVKTATPVYSPDCPPPVGGAPFTWATCLAAQPCGGYLLGGDVGVRPLAPNQAVRLLTVGVGGTSLFSCSALVPVPAPVMATYCGVVTADARSLPATALVVNGPVVVGQSDDTAVAPLPGALRFNPASLYFEGYDGTYWIPLQWASVG